MITQWTFVCKNLMLSEASTIIMWSQKYVKLTINNSKIHLINKIHGEIIIFEDHSNKWSIKGWEYMWQASSRSCFNGPWLSMQYDFLMRKEALNFWKGGALYSTLILLSIWNLDKLVSIIICTCVAPVVLSISNGTLLGGTKHCNHWFNCIIAQ